jgi:hypothetical protein
MWRKICVLVESSNFLDREVFGGLVVAIQDWAGAMVCLYVNAFCPYRTSDTHCRGKAAVVKDDFADFKSSKASGSNAPA